MFAYIYGFCIFKLLGCNGLGTFNDNWGASFSSTRTVNEQEKGKKKVKKAVKNIQEKHTEAPASRDRLERELKDRD